MGLQYSLQVINDVIEHDPIFFDSLDNTVHLILEMLRHGMLNLPIQLGHLRNCLKQLVIVIIFLILLIEKFIDSDGESVDSIPSIRCLDSSGHSHANILTVSKHCVEQKS